MSGIFQQSIGESDLGNRLKEDSLLLLRGFDSISHSLSQLTNNLDNALQVKTVLFNVEILLVTLCGLKGVTKLVICFQGARSLAKPPTLTDIFHCNLEKSIGKEEDTKKEDSEEERKRGLKRKLNGNEGSEDQGGDSQGENEQSPEEGKLKKAKNVGCFYFFWGVLLFIH